MERKTSLLTQREIFDIYIIYIQVILKRKRKQVPTDEICIYCSMNKKYVKGVQQMY